MEKNNIHSLYRKKLLKKRMSFQFPSNATPAAISTSVKQLKLIISPEGCDPTPPLPSQPWPFLGEGGQKAAGGRHSLLSETSCAVDKHHFPNIELTVNIQTYKRPVHVHTICTLR